MNNDQLYALYLEVAEQVMGIPFDTKFKAFVCSEDKPCPMWHTSVEFTDKKRQMTLDQMQQFAYEGDISFHTETEHEDSVCFEGAKFATDKSYGVYKIEDEEDVAYIGDDVINALCLIATILFNKTFNTEITVLRLSKDIDGDPTREIIMDYYTHNQSFWIYTSKKCQKFMKIMQKIFEAKGFTIQQTDTDDQNSFIGYLYIKVDTLNLNNQKK